MDTLKTDTIKKNKTMFTAIDSMPEYPGGYVAFGRYVSRNLKYPPVAQLIGIDGKLVMTFIVEKDGKITSAMPVNCIGAGCEAEATRLLESSIAWKPGVQKGKRVRVQYSVPIIFMIDKGKVTMKDLRSSGYGFVFKIKDALYTIDEAQSVIGKSFRSEDVKIAELFYNTDDEPKFTMPEKKEVYLLTMKE